MSDCGTVSNGASSRAISWQCGVGQFPLPVGQGPLPLSRRPCGRRYRIGPGHPTPGWSSLLRHSEVITPRRWCRNILPCCPSPTPFGLSLGPTNPGRTNLPQETLGFRRTGFSPVFSLLFPASSLPPRPAVLTICLHSNAECSPTAIILRW